MFKIGETSRPPFQRLKELSSTTGVPIPYEAVYFIAVRDRKAAERFVHMQLREYRVTQSKEFFSAPLKEVIAAMALAVRHFSDPFILQPFETEIVICKSCGAKNRVKRVGIQVRLRCSQCGEHIA